MAQGVTPENSGSPQSAGQGVRPCIHCVLEALPCARLPGPGPLARLPLARACLRPALALRLPFSFKWLKAYEVLGSSFYSFCGAFMSRRFGRANAPSPALAVSLCHQMHADAGEQRTRLLARRVVHTFSIPSFGAVQRLNT